MSNRAIIEAIRGITGTGLSDKVGMVPATVESVNEARRTVTARAIGGGAVTGIIDVQLMAEVDDGVLIIPRVGSTIIVGYSTYTRPYVALFSDVEKVVLLGGEHGGLVRIADLVDRLNKIEEKVNDLIGKFNDHVQAYNTHTHPVTAVGSPTGPTTATAQTESGTLTLTKREDMENEQVTHGS